MPSKGKLTIFLGMAPGVGKTYAMLQAAREQLEQGVDVVIGVVETHQRAETAALVSHIPSLPRAKMTYQNREFEELDYPAILAKNPQIILIDELAHTNIPGCLHEKRWQDVEGVLDAGIDVYTTLNIQHVESRAEEVRSLSGIVISETVPDLILESADQVRLVDLSPEDLLKRLQEGKVYLSNKIQQAATHFFKTETLSALRELVLRFVAEKVDSDLQRNAAFQTKKGIWNLNERLMVAVSHSPSSKLLIRTARRLAFSLGAPWVAVYVNQGLQLNPAERERLARNLELARNLGAEVVTISDSNLVVALKKVAAEKNITKIVTGRSIRAWWNFWTRSLSQRFVQELEDVDVYVVKSPKIVGEKSSLVAQYWQGGFHRLGYGAMIVALVVALSFLLKPFIGYQAVGFVFLLGILAIGTFASMDVIFGSALLSALLWDFLFIPPFGTFTIRKPEDIALCAIFLVTATVLGTFTSRLRAKETLISSQQSQTLLLFKVVQALSQSESLSSCIDQINELLKTTLSIRLSIATAIQTEIGLDPKEQAVLEWCWSNQKMAGWSTDTLPAAQNWYIPLTNQDQILGVAIITPLSNQKFLPSEHGLILTIIKQITLYLKKIELEDQAHIAKQLEESEKLYELILNCVSHELKTPMTTLLGNLEFLKQFNAQNENVKDVDASARRLKRVIDNLLDISKLSSGHISLNAEWVDVQEILNNGVELLSVQFETKSIEVSVTMQLPIIWADAALIERLIENLISNAILYSPKNTAVRVEIQQSLHDLILIVSDQGPGIPAEFRSQVFQKFYRVPGTQTGGTGLGLAICKEIVDLHHGKIEIKDNFPQGTQVVVALPYRYPNPESQSE